MRVKAGVLGCEGSKQGRNMPAAKIRRSTDPQQAARRTAARGDLGFRVADLFEDRLASLVQQQTFIGKPEPARAPLG